MNTRYGLNFGLFVFLCVIFCGCGSVLGTVLVDPAPEDAFVEKSTTEEAQPFGKSNNVTNQTPSPDVALKATIGPETLGLTRFPVSGEHQSAILALQKLGDAIISVDGSGKVLARNPNDKPHLILAISNKIDRVAISHENPLLATWSPSSTTIYSLKTGEIINTLDRLNVKVQSLEFDPSGKSILIGGADSRIYRWKFTLDPETLSLKEKDKIVERYIGPTSVVSSLWYHPEGRMFLSGDWFGKMYAWKPYDADRYEGAYDSNLFGSRFFGDSGVVKIRGRNLKKDTFAIDYIKSNNDGAVLLLGLQTGGLEVWDIRGMAQRFVGAIHKGPLYDIAVSPEGKFVASVGHDGVLSINQLTRTRSNVTQADEVTFTNLLSEASSPCRSLLFISEQNLICGAKNGSIDSRSVKAVE